MKFIFKGNACLCVSLIFCLLTTSALKAQKEKESVLWEITGNGMKKPSYLFGTFHLLNENYLNTLEGWQPKFKETEAVVVEMVIDSSKMMMMFQKMMSPDSALDKLLTKDEYKLTGDFLKEVSGMDISIFNTMKPASLSMILVVYAWAKLRPEDYNPKALSMDVFFEQSGKKNKKEVIALETMEQQLDLLYGQFNLQRQKEMLMDLVKDREKFKEDLLKMDKCYRSGNLQCLQEEVYSNQSYKAPELDAMLKDRNEAWMKTLPATIKSKPTFIAVGAGHLTGRYGLIELLKKRGFKVAPVMLVTKK